MSVTVTLIGKPGCHLCDDAQVIIDEVIADEPGVTLEKVSLDDNPLWLDLYGDLIPVVLIDGVEHAHWRLDKERFQSAVSECLTAEVD